MAQLKSVNPPNRFQSKWIEWLDEVPDQPLQVFEERAKSIVSTNDSPDIALKHSVNPYRGCFHACAYCYARPSHQYLDFGAGTDFERKLVVKVNAPELLRETFDSKKWKGEPIVFSGNTDCYQPLEHQYELTRRCLRVCVEYRNPVYIITKGALVRRDLDLLLELKESAHVSVIISLAFSDDDESRLVEPGAPRPSVRLRALRELSEAGIRTGISLSPLIPGLNDRQIPEIMAAAAAAGATTAFSVLLRLPAEVREVFAQRIEAAFPTRAAKMLSQIRDMKDGELNRSEFGTRMKGSGPRWEALKWLFDEQCKKYGFNTGHSKELAPTFRRPTAQLSLFEGK